METYSSFGAFSSLTNDGYSRRDVFQHAEKLVEIAAKYNGVVFGGYVRDVIVPISEFGYSFDEVDFEDLDFWFTSQEDADLFVEDSGLRKDPKQDEQNGYYPVNRNQCYSQYDGRNFIICDVMVTDFYPVCDFSVNLLSWDGKNLKCHQPYDIIAHLAKCKLERSQLKTAYTAEEFAALLHSKSKTTFTLEEIITICTDLKEKHVSLSPADKEFLESISIPRNFRTYTVDEIVSQIKKRKYDICQPFAMIAGDPSYRIFGNIRTLVANRMRLFHRRFSKTATLF